MLTYKVKLKFGSDEHEQYWRGLLATAMEAYNEIAQILYEEKTYLSLTEVHALVYRPMREKYPTIPSQGIIKIYKDAISNLRACRFKSCPIRKRPCMRLDKRLYSRMTTTSIDIVSHVDRKRLKVDYVTYPKFDELAREYEMKDPLICLEDDGQLYLCVSFAVPNQPVLEEKALRVDLGIRRIFTTSDGNSFKCKKMNALKRRIRYNRRKLQAKKTRSAKRKLKKLRHRERNVNKDFTHQICNMILDTDKTVIVIEDLTKIKQNTSTTKDGFKRKKHNNRMAQVPFYMIKEILSYKAPLLGKRVETVSPAFTSQLDCTTRKKDGSRVGCRYYSKSGRVFDADWNAAINIRNRKHPGSFSLPLDGKLNFLGQGNVNYPIVSLNLMEQAARSLVAQ